MFEYKKRYFSALLKQIEKELIKYKAAKESIKTLFIGGGTPSSVEAELYGEIFAFLKPYLSKNCEITSEANPNSATLTWIKEMKNFGVNRISFGVQSFDDDKLRYLGRNHSFKDAEKAVENAYISGIKNISLDLIHGVKNDTEKLLKKDLDIAFSLPINHISTYHLSIEKGTRFYKEGVSVKDDIGMQRRLYNEIKKRGFMQYEISNFGKYICKHNLGYWKYENYMGVGAGAVGFLKNIRFYPHKRVERYIRDPLFSKREMLNKSDIKTEKIFLGLRSIAGVKRDIFNDNESKRVELLLKEGKIFQKGDKIYNNDYLLSDEIALFILS